MSNTTQGAASPAHLSTPLARLPPARRDAALQALLCERPPQGELVAAVSECFATDGTIRQRLFQNQRWSAYIAALRAAHARGQLARLDDAGRAEIARHVFDIGRPALVRMLLPPHGQRASDTPARVALCRALALAGDATAARQSLAPDGPGTAWPERLLHAWFDQQAGIAPDPDFLHALLAALIPRPAARSAGAFVEAAETPDAVAGSLAALAACRPDEYRWISAGEAQTAVPGLEQRLASLDWLDLVVAERETSTQTPPHFAQELLSTHFGDWDEAWMRFAVLRAALNRSQAAGHGICFPDPFAPAESPRFIRARRSFMFGPNHFAHVYAAADPAHGFAVLSLCWNFFRRDVLLLSGPRLAVILSGKGNMPDPVEAVGALRACLSSRADAVRALLCAPPRPVLVSGLNPNIGHHYLNELSALADLRTSLPVVLAQYDYFDAASLFWPGEPPPGRCSLADLASHCLDRGVSPVWPSRLAAPARLARRVIDRATLRAARMRDEMRAQLGAGGRAVLFMLRSNRRIWAGQRDGICAAIAHLVRRHRITHFMLDGMTRTDPENPQEQQWIAAEQALVEELQARLSAMPGLTLISLVGRSVDEKVVAHGFVRFAVAPKGNGALPNLSWVRNVLCIEHGNAFDLPQAMVEARYREDGLLPLLMDRDAIFDELGPAMDRGATAFGPDVQLNAGYDLDRPALLALIEEATLRTA